MSGFFVTFTPYKYNTTMRKKLFILKINDCDDEPEFDIVRSTSGAQALLDRLTEMFNLDDEDEAEEYICEDMMRDEFFAVAPVAVGDIEFQHYYNLEELRSEIAELKGQ